MPFRSLDVLDAAERAADQVNALLARSTRPRLLHARQLWDAVQSVAANIAAVSGAAGAAPETARFRSRAARRRRPSAT
jgi:hypothetical protein